MELLGIIFALVAMFGFGIANSIAKIPIAKLGSVRTIVYRGFFSSLFILIVLLFFLKDIVFSLNHILIAVLIAFFGYLPLFFFYKGLSVGELGVISPIAGSSVIFTILFSVIFFKEQLSLNQVFFILMIIIGIILISINFKDFKKTSIRSSGILYALITCFLWGLVFFLFKIPVNLLGPILTSFIIELGVFLMAVVHNKFIKGSFKINSLKLLFLIILVSLFTSVGSLFFNIGISIASLSVVSAITLANPLIATLYGKIVYKEKLSAQQYLAVLIIISGIVFLSLF